MNETQTIPCACGCGEILERFDKRGRERKFIHGHWSRVQPNQRQTVTCEQCGKAFARPQWHLRKGLEHQFCSQACAGAWAAANGTKRGENNGHYNTITVECAGCGAPVSKAASLINRRHGRVYCAQCVADARSIVREPYTADFRTTISRAIRRRDNYTCQLCGKVSKRTLHVHHINYDTTDNRPVNLIALCPACHPRTNWGVRQWTERFQATMRERFPDEA